MKTILIIILITGALFCALVCYCLMRMASMEDRWMEEHGFCHDEMTAENTKE